MNAGNKQNTKKQTDVQATAAAVLKENNPLRQGRQFALWIAALILGGILGWMNVPFLNALFNFIATIFTRLFQFVAVPTIALAVITTLAAPRLHPADHDLRRRRRPGPVPVDCAGQPALRHHRCRGRQGAPESGAAYKLLRPFPERRAQ